MTREAERTEPTADMAALARGGRINFFGFILRLMARLPFLFIAGRMYGAEALGRFGTGLRRFADAHGKPDLYHETITTAYVLLIAERLDDGDRELDWDDFARRNPDLLTWRPSILARYYREETLASARAKRTFVMPDRLEITRSSTC